MRWTAASRLGGAARVELDTVACEPHGQQRRGLFDDFSLLFFEVLACPSQQSLVGQRGKGGVVKPGQLCPQGFAQGVS